MVKKTVKSKKKVAEKKSDTYTIPTDDSARRVKLVREIMSRGMAPDESASSIDTKMRNIIDPDLAALEEVVYLSPPDGKISDEWRFKINNVSSKIEINIVPAAFPPFIYQSDESWFKNWRPWNEKAEKAEKEKVRLKDLHERIKEVERERDAEVFGDEINWPQRTQFSSEDLKELKEQLEQAQQEPQTEPQTWWRPTVDDEKVKESQTQVQNQPQKITRSIALQKIEKFEQDIADKTKQFLKAKRELFVLNVALERAYKSIPADDLEPVKVDVEPENNSLTSTDLKESLIIALGNDYETYKSGEERIGVGGHKIKTYRWSQK
jgi:hypothetical protein